MAVATITGFGIQAGTDRTVYATWSWTRGHTKGYNVRWYYDTGDTNGSGTIWFIGNDSEVTDMQDTYSAPSNAKRVRFIVKPVSETYKNGDNDVAYWTDSDWSTEKIYNFISNIPTTPSAPTVKLEKYLLTASLDNVDTDATIIQFQVLKDNSIIFATGQATVEGDYKYAQYSCYVDAGSEYKVRCRGCRNSLFSEWSEYSEKLITIPAAPSGFTECYAKTSTSVYLEWEAVNTAKTYAIEYANDLSYFDSSDKTTTISGIESTRYEKTGLEKGDTYYFRLRAVNDTGSSPWSEFASTTVGKAPGAPTTWSSTTTAIVGEALSLYWVHNSEDGSSQTYAELELLVNNASEVITIQNSTEEDKKDKTSVYILNTTKYEEGNTIKWRVRTRGVTETYGEWSVQRSIDIYAPPTLTLTLLDTNGDPIETLESFPIRVTAVSGTSAQRAIGFHLSVTSNEAYDTVDALGNPKTISQGDTLYSKYFDRSPDLSVTLSASDIRLSNNISYKVTCVASMNSGLTAESSVNFIVGWAGTSNNVNCKIYIDTDTYAASISPYCKLKDGTYPEDLKLAVYRREYDGKFTEIASEIDNAKNMFVTDPHPALDYARYRIVATSVTTGLVDYYDAPAYPVNGTAVVIQWDEAWSEYDQGIDDTLASPLWNGSMIKLPYNIDISDSNSKDVTLVEYIGREHPVDYYGTHLGTKSTWNMDIPASDKEAIYALRKLQNWMGSVYVREPSGAGYWASISVSFSKKHCEVTIPVTIEVTRVEGGI